MREIDHPVPGNAEVVDGLIKAAERASGRKVIVTDERLSTSGGLAKAVAMVFCEEGGADCMYLGDIQARAQVVYGCELMKHMLVTSTSMNVRPLTPTITADFVKYDLTSDPICFDFVPWMVTAEMRRRQEGAPGPLKVAFVRHPGSLAPVTDQKWQFFLNVIRPSMELFGAVEDAAAANGRHEEYCGLREIALMHKGGIEVPKIKVPEPAMQAIRNRLGNRNPVTLTLREGPSYQHRNSDVEEWDKLAQWFSREGEDVIVVRDTARASEPFGPFEICPEASQNLHMRAALYEQSKCNLFVTNGPWGLAYFGSKPWLTFATITDDQPEGFNRPEWWGRYMGLNEDKQLPWATPQQRIVYENDKFENMKAAYKALQI